jgi:hypothetical protein
MANRKIRKVAAGSPRKSGERRRSAGDGRNASKGDAFVDATRQVIEDEIRKGDVPVAPDPDQKGEPGSRV